MVLLLILIFAVIIYLEVPRLSKKKMWRELTVFFVLLVIGMVYSFGQLFDLPLPIPTKGIEFLFRPISNFVNNLLL